MTRPREQCEGCGACCKAIFVGNQVTQAMKDWMKSGIRESELRYTSEHSMDGDFAFIMANFYPITLAEALKRNPHLQTWMDDNTNGTTFDDNTFMGCVNLDSDTGRCMIHDNLGRLCSGYPRYGAERATDKHWYADDCYYKRDLEEVS